MALKDDWKKTGKGLGQAFAGLGNNICRSMKDGVGYAADATDDEIHSAEKKETVFNDGSWRKTGKELGGAFKGLAHSILKSAEIGLSKLDENDSKSEDNNETK